MEGKSPCPAQWPSVSPLILPKASELRGECREGGAGAWPGQRFQGGRLNTLALSPLFKSTLCFTCFNFKAPENLPLKPALGDTRGRLTGQEVQPLVQGHRNRGQRQQGGFLALGLSFDSPQSLRRWLQFISPFPEEELLRSRDPSHTAGRDDAGAQARRS